MNFLKRTITFMPAKEPQVTRRLFKDCWEQMGHVKREPDKRTTPQLLENIEYYAKKYPEVAKFKFELKSINTKYLGLVSDICELADRHEFVNTAIDIKKPASHGNSLFQFLIEKLPQTAKENPEFLDLSKAIIDNTDSLSAKYALGSLSPLYDCKEAASHMKATVPLVGDIAEATLSGGYTMDYSKEQNFVNGLKSFISPNVLLEKLQALTHILKVASTSNATCQINAFPFLTNKTSINKIFENLKVFKELDTNMEGKSIDITEFLEKM